jgi:hypothetical protein
MHKHIDTNIFTYKMESEFINLYVCGVISTFRHTYIHTVYAYTYTYIFTYKMESECINLYVCGYITFGHTHTHTHSVCIHVYIHIHIQNGITIL